MIYKYNYVKDIVGVVYMFGFFKKNNKENESLKRENRFLKKRVRELEELSEEKDSFFKELISDGLRHKSKLAAKHMRDRKDYLNNK